MTDWRDLVSNLKVDVEHAPIRVVFDPRVPVDAVFVVGPDFEFPCDDEVVDVEEDPLFVRECECADLGDCDGSCGLPGIGSDLRLLRGGQA